MKGSASTGHSTGPNGAIERARLSEGSLLALRTGRGAWHAEGIGADEVSEGHGDTEFRGVLFWVNLARKDKQVEPSAQVLQPDEIPTRHEDDAIVRTLVGEGSPVQPGDAGADRRRRAPDGRTGDDPGSLRVPGVRVPAGRRGHVRRQRRRAKPPQLVVLGPGREFTVTDAVAGTRFLLMAGKPYGEVPVFNGPYVD